MKIILASKSPRRRELLLRLGYNFEIMESNCDETWNKELSPLENCTNISYEKGLNVLNRTEGNRIIISSDTIVVMGSKVFGKPKDRDDAYSMLNELNNKTHEVITTFHIFKVENDNIEEYQDYSKAKVVVDKLSRDEINNYLDTNEAYDKAGSYAIQGIFSKHIKEIQGDYYAIMGLSINKIYNIMKKIIK